MIFFEEHKLWIIIGAVILLIQLFYFLVLFRRGRRSSNNIEYREDEYPISVIVSARNEAHNLPNLVERMAEQEYSDFELIIVNDRSWDNSTDILKHLDEKYRFLRVVEIPDIERIKGSKKLALTLGVKAAKNPYLLFTDADCIPNSNLWIHEMQKGFNSETELVLGVGAYNIKKGFLNKCIRFETVQIALQYLGLSATGHTYMGVGRNIAYKKTLFFKIGGYKSHYSLKSGDDDLFVQQAVDFSDVSFVSNNEAITFSEPVGTLKDWIKQKKRHLSTARHYKIKDQFLLGLYSLSTIVFYSFVIKVSVFVDYRIGLTVFFCRFIAQIVMLMPLLRKMKALDTIWLLPFIELVVWGVNAFGVLFNRIIEKENKWE